MNLPIKILLRNNIIQQQHQVINYTGGFRGLLEGGSIFAMSLSVSLRRYVQAHQPFYKNFSMHVINVDSGTAPITASFFSPFLNMMTVGILRIPYWVAIEGLSSVLTL